MSYVVVDVNAVEHIGHYGRSNDGSVRVRAEADPLDFPFCPIFLHHL